MSSTNKTANYDLTQFLGSDVPSWLTDYNGDMAKIDAQMLANATAAATAQSTANSADSKADTATNNVAALQAVIDTPNTGLADRISDVESDVNTIQSLIGNGVPTTQDKTIIGAINELAGEIGGGTAADITYDNTASGLTADDVQEAIDELQTEIQGITPGGNVDADDVSYDNTTSGLTGANVQAAIDELKTDIDNIKPARRYVVIADSYGIGTHGNITPWTDRLETKINAASGNFYAYAEDNMGFVKQGDSSHNALQLLQSHSSDIANHDTITDVVFGLGINDYDQTTSALATNIESLVAYVKTEYPNATIWFGYTGNIANKDENLTTANGVYVTIKNDYALFAEYGAKTMDGIEFITKNCRNLQSDNVHPTNDASAIIANFMYDFLMGGRPIYRCAESVALTGALAGTNITVIMSGEVTTLIIPKANTAAAITINQTDGDTIAASMTNPAVRPFLRQYAGTYSYTGSGYQPGSGGVQGKDLYVLVSAASVSSGKLFIMDSITIPTELC